MPSKKPRVQAFLDQDLYDKLVLFAQEQGLPISQATAQILESHLFPQKEKDPLTDTEGLLRENLLETLSLLFSQLNEDLSNWTQLLQSGVTSHNSDISKIPSFSFDYAGILDNLRFEKDTGTVEQQDLSGLSKTAPPASHLHTEPLTAPLLPPNCGAVGGATSELYRECGAGGADLLQTTSSEKLAINEKTTLPEKESKLEVVTLKKLLKSNSLDNSPDESPKTSKKNSNKKSPKNSKSESSSNSLKESQKNSPGDSPNKLANQWVLCFFSEDEILHFWNGKLWINDISKAKIYGTEKGVLIAKKRLGNKWQEIDLRHNSLANLKKNKVK